MQGIIMIDADKCTGCRMCELICSAIKEGEFLPSKARIKVFSRPRIGISVPMVCLQCEKPLCQDACPNGAIIENSHGILYVNQDTCIGCMNCVTACVYGGIAIDPQTKKAIKCDLCDGEPACVKACDYGAISVAIISPEGLGQRRKSISPAFRTLGIQVEEGQE